MSLVPETEADSTNQIDIEAGKAHRAETGNTDVSADLR